MGAKTKETDEFKRFDAAMDSIMSTSREVLKKREEEWKRRKEQKRALRRKATK